MGNRKHKAPIYYNSFDNGDIVRLGFFYADRGFEEECVYEIVAKRDILSGLFMEKHNEYYALKRLDKPGYQIEILNTKEINQKISAKRISRLFYKIDSDSFGCDSSHYDITIDVVGEKYQDTDDNSDLDKASVSNYERIGSFSYSSSKEDFLLICEEIHTIFNSLVDKEYHGYHGYRPQFHDRIEEGMEQWLKKNVNTWLNNKVYYGRRFWRYSEETQKKALSICR